MIATLCAPAEFLETLKSSGVPSVKLPPRSPNFNAHAERFVRTVKESCLERMILFGEGSVRKAIHEFLDATRESGERTLLEKDACTLTYYPAEATHTQP